MKALLLKVGTKEPKAAQISIITQKELPLKKKGWNFDWKKLFDIEGANVYEISLEESLNHIEGLLMLTIFNDEMVFMNNIENAPHNLGEKRIYEKVAGCLIAFACKMSFEFGKGNYRGFLSFDSKTELIGLYREKYGAKLAMGNKMYIDPKTGIDLMKRYLMIDI